MSRGALVHRHPRRAMHRNFDSLFTDLFATPFVRPSVTAESAGFVPCIDAVENDKEYVVTAELPGLEEKDFQIEIEDGVLTLKGEKHARYEESDEGQSVRRVETSYGKFERRLRFDSAIDENAVKASYKDGVLSIVVAKPEEAQPQVRTIPVQTA